MKENGVSHAAAAISGGLHACSRIAVQASGRVDVQSGVLKGKEDEESKPPLSNVTWLHTRTKDISPSIPVQASSYSVFRQTLYCFHDGALCLPFHYGVCVGADHCGTTLDPTTFVLPRGRDAVVKTHA